TSIWPKLGTGADLEFRPRRPEKAGLPLALTGGHPDAPIHHAAGNSEQIIGDTRCGRDRPLRAAFLRMVGPARQVPRAAQDRSGPAAIPARRDGAPFRAP